MLIIMGKVIKMEITDSGDQKLDIKIGNRDNMLWSYAILYFKGSAPFQLGEEVEVCFKKKDEKTEQKTKQVIERTKEIINEELMKAKQ